MAIVQEGYRKDHQIQLKNNEELHSVPKSRLSRIRPKISPDYFPSAKYEFYTSRCLTSSEENIIDTYERLNPFYCSFCKGNCENDVTFQMHMKDQRKGSAISKSGYTFLENLDIWVHFYARFGIKVYCCQICEFKSTREPTLSKHIISHIGEKPFMCPLCKTRFPSKPYLIKHMSSHVMQMHIEEYFCLLCGDICPSTAYYKRHINAHANKITYSCWLCITYKCDTIQDLLVHSAIHSSSVSHQYQDINIENGTIERKNIMITTNGNDIIKYDLIKDSHSTGEETDTASENEDIKADTGKQVPNEFMLLTSENEDTNSIQNPIKEELIDFSFDMVKEEIATHENYYELALKHETEDQIMREEDIKSEFLAPVEFDFGSIQVEEIYLCNQQCVE